MVTDVTREGRLTAAADIVKAHGSTIVFCRTKRGADRVARQLAKNGVKAVAIHGDRSQNQRTKALDEFSRGKALALVATDVAARGIHVDDVACVIHYDPPADDSTYVHRSGRTGRAGNTGVVVSLILDKAQRKDAAKMFAALGVRPEVADVPTSSAPTRTRDDKPVPSKSKSKSNAGMGSEGHGGPLRGEVKFFDGRRGFGFILHGGRDLFVHKSNVTGRLREGQQVDFVLGRGPKGEEAQQVTAA